MTREEAHSIIKLLVNAYNIGYKDGVEAYKAMMELEKEEKEEDAEDCISRQAVDEYITNLLSGYLYDEERTRLEDLSAFVWELPSVQPTRPTGRWIPCTERLPEDGRPVLIYAWNVHHVVARYDSFRTENGYKKCWVTADAWNGNTEIKHDVIAWMPLPEPYKANTWEKVGTMEGFA